MACKQHTTAGKTRKRSPALTERSKWACWMNGADPEWMHTDDARQFAAAFPKGLPQWLIRSDPWRKITGVQFKTLRRVVLGLSTAQCAAYLGVCSSSITRWESDSSPVPVAAFEALRLQSETMFSRLSHEQWDGWFFHRQTGEFVSPDVGRLAFKPAELNALPMLYAKLQCLEQTAAEQAARIDQLEAENAALRGGTRVKAVVSELESMQGQIAQLIGALRTADVIPFPTDLPKNTMRATA